VVLTKAWLVVVGLALAIVLALALVVPRPAMRELEKEQVARLAHVQHASQLLLKVDARSKIDYAAHLSGDVVLAGALDEASRGGTDKGLHQTALERLRVFNSQLKMAFLVALDAHGRVLARVTENGEGDAQAWGDSMAGFPVIADALRGYRGEDAVAIGGKLYRLAASPVIKHDRYAGALVIGMAAGDDLAKRMHESLGAEVAFMLHGKVVASTTSTPALEKLPAELDKRAEEIAKQGHTPAVALESGANDRWWAMATPVAGEAAAQDAWYVLLLPRTAGTGLGGLVHAAGGDDFKSGYPWILVIMVALVALAGGIAIVWWESESPMARLRDEVGRLAAGELPRLDDRPFRGRFAQVVRSINSTLDRLVRSGGVVGVTTLSADRNMPAPSLREREPASRVPTTEEPLPASYEPMMIAGQAAPVSEAKVAAPPMPKLQVESQPLPKFPLEALDEDPTTQDEHLPAPSSRAAAKPGLPALPQLDAIPLDAVSSKQRPAPRPGQPPATPRAPAAQVATPMPVGMGRAAAPPSAPAPKPAAPKPAPAPSPAPRKPAPFGLPMEELEIAPSSGLVTNAVAAGPDGIAPLPPPPAPDFGDETVVSQPSDDLIDQSRGTGVHKSDLEAYFRKVYQDFVELKRKCGEPTENVTFEKFVGKLRDNREQLIKKLGCKSVKFQVYVKDGRAALKATPVRD
jgi:hypothetical protein